MQGDANRECACSYFLLTRQCCLLPAIRQVVLNDDSRMFAWNLWWNEQILPTPLFNFFWVACQCLVNPARPTPQPEPQDKTKRQMENTSALWEMRRGESLFPHPSLVVLLFVHELQNCYVVSSNLSSLLVSVVLQTWVLQLLCQQCTSVSVLGSFSFNYCHRYHALCKKHATPLHAIRNSSCIHSL